LGITALDGTEDDILWQDLEDENDDSEIVKMIVMNKATGRTLSNNLSFQNVLCIVCVNNRMFKILCWFVSRFLQEDLPILKFSSKSK
jgi:hypothetical protein